MANTSIFDCGSPETLDLPRRQIVSYGDDEDIFRFDYDEPGNVEIDKNNVTAKKLRFTITVNSTDDANRKQKRPAAYNDDVENSFHHHKKHRIANTKSCSTSTSTSSKTKSMENGTKTNKNHSKHSKSESEPYKIIKEIGKGTYGKVFIATYSGKNSVIAIKRLTCELHTPNTVNLFVRKINCIQPNH